MWRGWFASSSGRAASVRSLPLSPGTPQSRFFPKTRSWLALGAPLELMSPLSILRVIFGLAVVLWTVEDLTLPSSRGAGFALGASTAAAGVVWLLLRLVRSVTARSCTGLAVLGAGLVMVQVSGGDSTASVAAASLYLMPFATFVALYLGFRVVLSFQLAVSVGLAAVVAHVVGWGAAVVVAVATTVAMLAASSAIRVLMASVWRSGSVDPETGLPNAVGLSQRLSGGEAAYAIATVLLAGIDDARQALGYWAGSELLRRAVEDLGQVLPNGAFLSRVEGDELVVTLPFGRSGPEDAWERRGVPEEHLAAGRALCRILGTTIDSGHYIVDGVEVSLRAHVGLAFSPWNGSDVTEVVRRASLAANEALESGRLEETWSGDHGTLSAADLALLAHLRLAPERGELRLEYQPQVDARTGQPVAAEALLRWESKEHGLVATGHFISLAERTGLVDRLTRWVVSEALDAQARWQAAGLSLPVAVNLSAKTLVSPELADWIMAELSRRELGASSLIVEVTETAVGDRRLALQLLAPLHDQGVQVAIDDFGTGYTSLAAIPHLPLDQIKVDMSFVKRALASPPDEAIVRSVRELVHRLGLVSVAEGVEDESTLRLMSEIGFDLLQGFHLARPLTEPALLSFVAGRPRPHLPAPPKLPVREEKGAFRFSPRATPSPSGRRLDWERRPPEGESVPSGRNED